MVQLTPQDPVLITITEPPKNPAQDLAEVFIGALGLTGVIAVGAVLVGIVLAGLLLWVRRRPA